MKKMISFLYRTIIVCIVVIICTLIIAEIIVCPIINDFVAKNVVKDIQKIELPEETVFIESISDAGKLCGNGNGMDYFGAILIQSDLSFDELKEYYSIYEGKIFIEPQTRKDITVIEHDSISFKTNVSGDDYYIVYSWGNYNGIASEFDLRGH